MTLLALYMVTLIVFLIIDYIGLSCVVKPVFDRHISNLIREDLRLGPAFAFYCIFVAGILYFVTWPALVEGHGYLRVAFSAGFLGFLAYGTYEFTNLATLKGWAWPMVVTDLAWGTVLSGATALIGLAIIRGLGWG